MIISHRHKFVFYKPLKVGGSSVEVGLQNFCGPDDIMTGSDDPIEKEKYNYRTQNVFNDQGVTHYHMHTSPDLLTHITNSTWSDYFRFSAVRNPWDLCVSYFWWCFHHPGAKQSPQTFSLSPKHDDPAAILRHKFTRFLSTEGFFSTGPRGPEGRRNIIEWLAQTNESFYKGVDYVMKYENLQDEYNKVCDRLGLAHEQLPRLKITQRKTKIHYSKYYDDASCETIRNIFSKTVDQFSYDFEKY